MKVAFDIDGVLADVKDYAEKYLVGKKGNDWSGYFSQTENFPVIVPMVKLAKVLIVSGQQVCFVTGRPEHNRESTVSWIKWHIYYELGIPSIGEPWLFMRKNGDQRATADVKLEIFKWTSPELVFEDDPEAVKKFLEAGYTVVQVHGFRYNRRDLVPPE